VAWQLVKVGKLPLFGWPSCGGCCGWVRPVLENSTVCQKVLMPYVSTPNSATTSCVGWWFGVPLGLILASFTPVGGGVFESKGQL
jgi:hypothetical protein